MNVTEHDIHRIVDKAKPRRSLDLLPATVDAYTADEPQALVKFRGSSTAVPVEVPALPLVPVRGDLVDVLRSTDGRLVLTHVRDRSVPAVTESEAMPGVTVIRASGGDDLATLQAAVDTDGVHIWLPDDTYLLSDELWITKHNVHIMGKGSGRKNLDGTAQPGTTQLVRTVDTGATAVVRFAPLLPPPYTDAPLVGGSISNLNIRGNGMADYGLLLQGTQDVSTYDVDCTSALIAECIVGGRVASVAERIAVTAISVASPSRIRAAAHGLTDGQLICFYDTSATGLTTCTEPLQQQGYYVDVDDADHFYIYTGYDLTGPVNVTAVADGVGYVRGTHYATRGGAHHRMHIGATGATHGLYLGDAYGLEWYGPVISHGTGVGVYVINTDDITLYSPYVTGGPGLDMDVGSGGGYAAGGYNFTTVSGYPTYGTGITVRSPFRGAQFIGRSLIDNAATAPITFESGSGAHDQDDRGRSTFGRSVAHTFAVTQLTDTNGAVNAYRIHTIGGTTVTSIVMPRSGSVTAVSMSLQAARTGGVLLMYVLKNGAALSLTCQIDSFTTQHAYATAAPEGPVHAGGGSGNTFAAGDRLSVMTYVTSATFNEYASDATISFEVTYD